THELWEQACRDAGVWHDVDAYQRQSAAERKAYEERRPAKRKKADELADRVGHTEASRAWQGESTQAHLLMRAIRQMPARTLAGLKAKAEATTHWHYDDGALDPADALDAHDQSLMMMLGDIAAIEEPKRSRFDGPALPDLSTLSHVDLWMLYK